jgi:hypothetical protein
VDEEQVPPLPAFQLRLFATLEQRLQSAGRAAMLLAVERIESCIVDLDPSGLIPADFIEFKVLGTQSPHVDGGVMDARVAIGDLATLAERLCSLAKVTPTDPFAADLILAEELCSTWSISRKTLDRLRRKGLSARRISLADGTVRVGFHPMSVDAFALKHRSSIDRAGAFTRIPREQQEEMIRRAAKYRRILRMSLNATAQRLANRFNRSLEAVRQLLRRHDLRLRRAGSAAHSLKIMQGVEVARPPSPIFGDSGPLNASRRALAFRAWRMGIDIGTIARKLRRSRASVRRALFVSRAERLFPLLVGEDLIGPTLPTFAIEGAEDVFLRPKPVCEGLGAGSPTDLLEFLNSTQASHPPLGHVERKRIEAYQFLRYRARRMIDALGSAHPRAGNVDQIEVYLLWASRLKAELIRSQFPMMMKTIAGRAARAPSELPVPILTDLLIGGITEIGRIVDRFDPASTGRLAAPAAIAVDRFIATRLRSITSRPSDSMHKRATAIIPKGVKFPDWTLRVNVWQEFLELDPRVRAAAESGVASTQARSIDLLRARYGLQDGPPRTLAELAKQFDTTPARMAAMEHDYVVHALRVSRATLTPSVHA